MTSQSSPILIGLCTENENLRIELTAQLTAFYGFERYRFELPAQAALDVILGAEFASYTRSQRQAYTIPELGKSYSNLLYSLYCEWGLDKIGENFWLKIANQRWQSFCERKRATNLKCPGWIITEVYTEDQAQWIRRQPNGVIWHPLPAEDYENGRSTTSETVIFQTFKDVVWPMRTPMPLDESLRRIQLHLPCELEVA